MQDCSVYVGKKQPFLRQYRCRNLLQSKSVNIIPCTFESISELTPNFPLLITLFTSPSLVQQILMEVQQAQYPIVIRSLFFHSLFYLINFTINLSDFLKRIWPTNFYTNRLYFQIFLFKFSFSSICSLIHKKEKNL